MSEIRELSVEFFKVLADQTRLEILYSLKERSLTQAEIQEKLSRTQSTISQHLNKLKSTNLIESELQDNVNHYKVKNSKIFEILNLVQTFILNMNDFDRLDTLF
jgi:DNA-binding transcriptional ArsR family regulator